MLLASDFEVTSSMCLERPRHRSVLALFQHILPILPSFFNIRWNRFIPCYLLVAYVTKNELSVIVIGATKPSTSYIELMVDIIFFLVRILDAGCESDSRVSIDLFDDIASIFVLRLSLTDISFDFSCT